MGSLLKGRAVLSHLVLTSRLSWLALLVWANLGVVAEGAIAASEAPQRSSAAQASDSQSDSRYAQVTLLRVEITDIRVETTEAGAELVITATDELAASTTTTLGNATIVEIPGAALSEEFQSAGPVDGIAFIEATETTDGQVRISITGTDAPPAIATRVTPTGIVLGMTPSIATGDGTDDAIRLEVTGEQDSYTVDNATTGTRTNTPLFEVPQSIQVIPRIILEQQQATSLNEVLRNSPGVIQGNTFGGSRDNFTIRGFENATILRDGFQSRQDSFRETVNVERVEVLKGPAAILFGNIEPGGAINLVSEQPEDEFAVEVATQVGSYGLIRPTFDVTGPVNSSGSIRYRLNGVYEHSDGFRGFETDLERYFVAFGRVAHICLPALQ